MKKLLIIGALATTIGASMVSGTLARYSKSWDDQGTVKAKHYDFEVKCNDDKTLEKNLEEEIIPGERVDYLFNVNDNESEVDMDLNVDVLVGDNNVGAENKNIINGLKVTLQENKNGEWVKLGETETHKDKAGRITIKDKLIGDSKNDARAFRLAITWDDYNNAEQNGKHVESGEKNAITPIRVCVNGTQARHN